jgi:hypothetical protein
MAEGAPAAAFIAEAVNQTLQLANIQGYGDRFCRRCRHIGAAQRREHPRPRQKVSRG